MGKFRWTVAVVVVAMTLLVSAGAYAQLLTGFESVNPLQGEDHVISVVASTEWMSEGSRSLKINHSSIPAGNQNRLWVRAMEDTNWSGATSLMVDFYVPTDAPHNYSAAVVIQVGDGWTWYESDPIALSPGENLDVTFPLNTNNWRSAATGWQTGATVPLQGMRAWGFLVFSDNREPGHVYLDNVRLVRAASDGDSADFSPTVGEKIRISGSASLTVISQPITIPGTAPVVPVGLVPNQWEIDPGSGERPTLVTTTGPDGTPVQALKFDVASGVTSRVDLGGSDLSSYKYLVMDIKQVGGGNSKGMQFILQDSSWSYHDTQHFPHVPVDEWTRIELTVDHFGPGASWSDIKVIGFRTWDGPAEFLVTNMHFLGEADDETTEISLSRSHEITVHLDYDMSPDWSLRIGAIFADPIARLGLVQAKGNLGQASVRAFYNGTGSDLGDPLALFKGSKYNENNTSGIDVAFPLGAGSIRGQYLTPSRTDEKGKAVAIASLNMPHGNGANYTLFAANEAKGTGQESTSAFGVAAKFGLTSGMTLTGEYAIAGPGETHAWLASATMPWGGNFEITVQAQQVADEAWRAYSDHQAHGKQHIDAYVTLGGGWSAGLYLQRWYNMSKTYLSHFGKASLNWSGSGIGLQAYHQIQQKRNPSLDEPFQFDHGRTAFSMTTKFLQNVDAKGIFWLDHQESGQSLPTFVGRIGFSPIKDVSVTLESGHVQKSPSESSTNVFTKITRKFAGGELALSFGKPTLNSNDDAHNNTSTAKDYVELKLSFDF